MGRSRSGSGYQAIATQRASHLQDRRMAQFYAAMGYPAAARTQAAKIAAPAVRFGTEIRIRHDSPIPMAAYAVYTELAPEGGPGMSAATSSGAFFAYSDPLVDASAKPLPPGEERLLVSYLKARRGAPPALGKGPAERLDIPVRAAGILLDNSTTGDAALLSRLVLRCCNLLQAVEMALDILIDAGRHNIPPKELIGRFDKLAASLRHWYLPPEQQVGQQVYREISGKLLNLPQPAPGSPFPPTDFVDREAAALNSQRVTLLASQPALATGALIAK